MFNWLELMPGFRVAIRRLEGEIESLNPKGLEKQIKESEKNFKKETGKLEEIQKQRIEQNVSKNKEKSERLLMHSLTKANFHRKRFFAVRHCTKIFKVDWTISLRKRRCWRKQ